MVYCGLGRFQNWEYFAQKFPRKTLRQKVTPRNHFIRVKLEDPDDDEDVDNCTIVLGLIQKNRRKQKRVGAQNLTIGFSVYKVRSYY